MMLEVDQFSQGKCVATAEISIISFPSFRFGPDKAAWAHSGDVVA
jgi:hypothetical protein